MDYMNLLVLILGALFAISEVLGQFDYFKNSNVFGVAVSFIKKGIELIKSK